MDKKRLSEIELLFVEEYCKFFDGKKACKAVGLPKDEWTELLRNPDILRAIRKRNTERQVDCIVSSEYLAEIFREMVSDMSIPASARVKAAENLAKIQERMLAEDKHIEDRSKNSASIRAEELLNKARHLNEMASCEVRNREIEENLTEMSNELGLSNGEEEE